jgi:hypothetical protein
MIHVYNGKLYTNVVNPKLEYVTDSIFPPYNPYYWITFREGPKAQFTRVDFRDFSKEINNNYIEINNQRFKYEDMLEKEGLIDALLTQEETLETLNKLP